MQTLICECECEWVRKVSHKMVCKKIGTSWDHELNMRSVHMHYSMKLYTPSILMSVVFSFFRSKLNSRNAWLRKMVWLPFCSEYIRSKSHILAYPPEQQLQWLNFKDDFVQNLLKDLSTIAPNDRGFFFAWILPFLVRTRFKI